MSLTGWPRWMLLAAVMAITATFRAGDPCSCPDPLHGSISGHVEPVGGPLVRGHLRDWPSEEAEGPLLGP
jgi:hypothetical protein